MTASVAVSFGASCGNTVATYQYDVYGAIRAQSGSSGNEFTFTGQQNDPTGLEYLRARYYDKATGRFVSRDPIAGVAERPETQQPYTYGLNNPCSVIDPSGATAAESGFSLTVCSATVQAEGVGRFAFPICILGIGCYFAGQTFDKLFGLSVNALFLNTPGGSAIAYSVTPSNRLGWERTVEIESAVSSDRELFVSQSYDTAGRPVLSSDSGSIDIRFRVNSNGEGNVDIRNAVEGRFSSLTTFSSKSGCRTIRLF